MRKKTLVKEIERLNAVLAETKERVTELEQNVIDLAVSEDNLLNIKESLNYKVAQLETENEKLDKNWMNAIHRNVAAEKKFKALLKELNDLVKEAEDNKSMTKQELSFAIEIIILSYMEV